MSIGNLPGWRSRCSRDGARPGRARHDDRRGHGRRRRGQGDRHRQAGARSVAHRPVGGRPDGRRDAPGPRRGRGQRGAAQLAPRLAEQKMAAVTGGLRIPGMWLSAVVRAADRAGRPPHRGLLAPARHRSQDGPAADLPPAARARGARRATLAAALIAVRDEVVFCDGASTSATGPLCPICLDPGRATSGRLCVVEEPLDVLAHRAHRRVPGPATTCSTAPSRPMDGIGPDRLRIRELLERVDERRRRRASRSRRSSWPPTRPSRARPRRCTSPSGWTATSAP